MKSIRFLCIFSCYLVAIEGYSNQKSPEQFLKPRAAEWRSHVEERYPSGATRLVYFYEEQDGKEMPVKRMLLGEDGRILGEEDLITVLEESPGAQKWKSKIVPHGASLLLHGNQKTRKMGF